MVRVRERDKKRRKYNCEKVDMNCGKEGGGWVDEEDPHIHTP